ncbi:MAG: hypothetical protein HPM95_14140 [Alphaproteobacteria bacterium]|nr:hypothetical protein [Alphaproteobacteria bacterium]
MRCEMRRDARIGSITRAPLPPAENPPRTACASSAMPCRPSPVTERGERRKTPCTVPSSTITR